MSHSVLLLSRYERKGPSSRVRHYNFLPALERAGFVDVELCHEEGNMALWRGRNPVVAS